VRAEIDRRAMALLSSGHMATDFANGALPALLPFLKERFSLSYTAVGGALLPQLLCRPLVLRRRLGCRCNPAADPSRPPTMCAISQHRPSGRTRSTSA